MSIQSQLRHLYPSEFQLLDRHGSSDFGLGSSHQPCWLRGRSGPFPPPPPWVQLTFIRNISVKRLAPTSMNFCTGTSPGIILASQSPPDKPLLHTSMLPAL